MAIQSRRGAYGDFDPDKMLPGEWASVLKDDPKAQDGKAVYMCFSAGDVKRMATYEDMKNNIQEATAEIIEQAQRPQKNPQRRQSHRQIQRKKRRVLLRNQLQMPKNPLKLQKLLWKVQTKTFLISIQKKRTKRAKPAFRTMCCTRPMQISIRQRTGTQLTGQRLPWRRSGQKCARSLTR